MYECVFVFGFIIHKQTNQSFTDTVFTLMAKRSAFFNSGRNYINILVLMSIIFYILKTKKLYFIQFYTDFLKM
jgi:hypothetical protein